MDPSFLFRHRSPSRDGKSLFRFLARRNTKDYQAANTLVPSGSLARLRRGDEWPPRDKAARDEVVFRQLDQVFFDRSPLRKNRRYVAFLARLGARPLILANYRRIPPPPREPIYLRDRALRPSVVTFRCPPLLRHAFRPLFISTLDRTF